MPPELQITQLILRIDAGEAAPADELDTLTRQLRDELLDLELESVELVRAGAAPEGTKAADPVAMGVLAVAVLPNLLPKLIDFLQAWAMRGQGRTVKFKGKIAGQEVEIEGVTPEELKALLATLAAPPATSGKRVEKPE